ncbi:MerC domain-containing protein [Catenovulum sp. 2E275]|uniref:MerC domain-containing protein n=1 Tax=Catenovulum sp. 2E275 TaxID=2980497 RepID=UPI0021D10613|nr:MerC domain-containing protein [Catenovulum sp. 2E275]MCU4677002.1 MerC domain-containing protein [Catenovulum sp. 2E275]
MTKVQFLSDKLAIFLSSVCLIHCLLLPFVLIVVPSLGTLLSVDHETFHLLLLYFVVPLGLVALTLGYQHHKNGKVLTIGLAGLLMLTLIAVFGHDFLGETLELALTVMTTILIAYAHYQNYKLRKYHDCKIKLSANHNQIKPIDESR